MGEFYLERAARYSAEMSSLRKQYDRLSLVRLAVFIAGAGLSALLFTVHWGLGLVATLVFLGGFYRLMSWHRKVQDSALHAEKLAAINLAEAQAIGHQFAGFHSGSEFLQQAHPYALDLDLFGDFSLFQYTCRATTSIGRSRLADFFLHPAPVPTVQARQAAIAELRPMIDWRQHFQAYGQGTSDHPNHLYLLREWLKDGDLVLGNSRLTWAIRLAPWYFLLAFIAWIAYLPWAVFLLLLAPIFLVLKKTNEVVGRIHLRTTHAGEMLVAYSRLIGQLEGQRFQSPLLASLRQQLDMEGQPASDHIKRLAYIIRQLNVRYNFFAIFLNIMGLWDLQWVLQLEKWRARLKHHLPDWFETLQEFEALCSLANLWANNPAWVLPQLHTDPVLTAQNLAHPLIHASKRVGNDLQMDTRGHIKLITGSNMAGKSTFLRTIGINIVMAQAGAPVCGQQFSLPPLQVFTSMRTQDALNESTSSFYAELKRLKVIIESVQAAATVQTDAVLPVFFLLDEILKGTNSVDRHTGSAALIRQLVRLKGGGLIATHDLDLGRLEAEAKGTIENLCMEVEIRDKALFFDYKLKKGVSKSFNATLLMQQMGIEM